MKSQGFILNVKRMKYSGKSLFVFVVLLLLLVSIIPMNGFAQPAPGEKTLTLTLTDTPLNQLLSIISETFGIGVVASKGATGNVNISLTNATLEETLNSITGPNQWEWIRDENTITIMTLQEYQAWSIKQVITKYFLIQHTNAQEVQNVIQPLLSSVGKIIRDDRTNQLQVSDTPESLARIEQVIQSVDVPIDVQVFALKYAVASDVKQQADKVKTAKGEVQVDERTNSLIVTDVPSAIEKIKTLIESLDVETQMEVFDIQYAKPKDIQAAIKDLVTKRGYIQVDERNGKVIVDDIPSHLEKIARVIKALDEPDRLVYIEAEIVDMDYQKSLDLGIDWSYGASWSLSGDSASALSIPIFEGHWRDSIKNYFSGYSSTLGLSASATAKAISKLGANTELLASPRIMVKNDEEAKFLVGGTQPYTVLYTQPITGTTGTSYQQYYSQVSQEFGIKLTVKPHINADGMIDMKVSIENTAADPVTLNAGSDNSFTGVKTTTSQANTFIQVKNNETVVIGGLVSKGKTESGSGIPILEDIPIIGPILFGSRSKSNSKRNLLLFITPHIVRGTRAEAEELYPEAYQTYSQATSNETDKERKERLKKEAKEKLKNMENGQIPVPPDVSKGQPVIPNPEQAVNPPAPVPAPVQPAPLSPVPDQSTTINVPPTISPELLPKNERENTENYP